MKFESVDAILKFAIDREQDAVDFYTSLAGEAESAALKQTFNDFAGEEQRHIALLSDIAGNKEKIDSYELKKIPNLKISDYMVETEYKTGMPMPEILKLAMKREEKAVKLYGMLAEQTADETVKKMMLILVQEESKHKLGLESMYDDYLADQEG